MSSTSVKPLKDSRWAAKSDSSWQKPDSVSRLKVGMSGEQPVAYPKYTGGEDDPQTPLEFLEAVDKFAYANCIDTDWGKICCAASCLHGQASKWWQAERTSVQKAKYSYYQFRQLFLEVFTPVWAARAGRLTARQMHLDTDIYSWRDQFIHTVLPSLTPLSSRGELLELFLRALPAPWVAYIRSYEPRDWEEACRLARMLDHLLRDKDMGLCSLPQKLDQWREMRRTASQNQRAEVQRRMYGAQASQNQPVNSIPGVPSVTAAGTEAGPVEPVPLPSSMSAGGAVQSGTLPTPALTGSGPRDPRVRVNQGQPCPMKTWPQQGPKLSGQGQAFMKQLVRTWAKRPQGSTQEQAQRETMQPALGVPQNLDPQVRQELEKAISALPGPVGITSVGARDPMPVPTRGTIRATGPVGVGPMIAQMAQANRNVREMGPQEGPMGTGSQGRASAKATPGPSASRGTTATGFQELDVTQEPKHVPLRIPEPAEGGYWESYGEVDDGPTPDGYQPTVPDSLRGSGGGSQASLHIGSGHRSHEGSTQRSQMGSGTQSQMGSGAGTGSQGRSSAGSLGSGSGVEYHSHPSDRS